MHQGALRKNSNIEVNSPSPIINISYAQGKGPRDQRDVGYVNGRTLNFTKLKGSEESLIRFGYTDILRVRGADSGCRWEIHIDDQPCSGGRLVYDYYSTGMADPHRSRNVIGYCEGISIGQHAVRIYVDRSPHPPMRGENDCLTGWYGESTWVLEAVEILKSRND